MLDFNNISDLLLWMEANDGFVDKSALNHTVLNNGVFLEEGAINGRRAYGFFLSNFMEVRTALNTNLPKSDNYTIFAVVRIDDLDIGLSNICTASAISGDLENTYYNIGINHANNGLSVSWGDGTDYENYNKDYLFIPNKYFILTATVSSDPFEGNFNLYND